MAAQQEAGRPVLKLIVNDDPHLTARRKVVHEATVEGEVVDPFWAGVFSLVDHIKSEYDRIIAQRPCEGPTVKLTLPADSGFDQIDEAFKLIRKQGWDIFPAMPHSAEQIYVRNYQC